MKIKTRIGLFSTSILIILLMAACISAETESPTELPTRTATSTTVSPTITRQPEQTASPSPSPLATKPSSTPVSGYPAPGASVTSAPGAGAAIYPPPRDSSSSPLQSWQPTPYPGAATLPPVITPAYPGPEGALTLPSNIDPSPSGSSPSARMETTPAPGADSSPYPAPGSTSPPQTPLVSPSAFATAQAGSNQTLTPGTPFPGTTGSPTPFPALTPTLVRAAFVASDPAEFSLISERPQMVVFFADWSPASKSMAPVVNGLADRYEGRVNFVFLDIDDPANALFKALMGSRLPPIFYLLDERGNMLNRWEGLVAVEQFEQVLIATVP